MDSCNSYSVFPVFCCGVDWLTCTSAEKGVSNRLEDWAHRIMKTGSPGIGQISPAKCLGYQGHRVDGMFCGRGPQGVMVQLSGPSCTPLTMEAITLSTNVSRIDTQVTVFTEGEACHLATWTWNQLVRQRDEGVGRGKLNLIRGHPDGETLEVNRRSGDTFGRLYDKTAEAKMGAPLLVWRYEVEWKGRRARWVADILKRDGCSPTNVSWLTHAFWTKRGVPPAFECPPIETAFQPFIACPDRDVLTWYRASVSKSIAKAISKYGRSAVLEALGLANYEGESHA